MVKRFKFNIFLTLFFLAIPFVVMIPLMDNHKVPLNHDYFNHIIAIAQAKIELMRGQFPLRVMNGTHAEWFYPYYQFYSSTTYTFAGWIHWFLSPNNPFLAYKLTLVCALFLGGLYMYRLCAWLFAAPAIAVVCGGLFVNGVYLNVLINHLGAFNEAVAVALVPATVFYSLQRFYHPDRQVTLLLMGLMWYLLATIHLITFVLASFTLGLFILFICFHPATRPTTFKKNAFNTLLGYILGCLLAMWFLGPIGIFSEDLHIRHTFLNNGKFFATTPTLTSLLSPTGHIAEALQQPPKPGQNLNTIFLTHPNIGCALLIGFFISCFIFLKCRDFSTTVGARLLPILLLLFCLIFFIIWSPFNFWQWLPNDFKFMQYSWRFLGQLTWIGTLLFGISLSWLFNNKLGWTFALGILVCIFVSNFYWYTHLQVADKYEKKIKLVRIPTNYLIDAKNNFKKFNSWIDHFLFDDKSFHRKPLELKKIKPLIIKTNDELNPSQIQITGKVAEQTQLHQEKLGLVVNGSIIDSFTLTKKPFDVTFTLKTNVFPQVTSFKVIDSEKKMLFKDLPIVIDSIRLSGYINKKYVLDLKSVRPNCNLNHNNLNCVIKNPQHKLLIELPVYYFPNMLRVFLNNVQIAYKSIYYGSYLIPYVRPVEGVANHYRVQFIGLDWANYISQVFWGFWLICLVYLVLITLKNSILKALFK